MTASLPHPRPGRFLLRLIILIAFALSVYLIAICAQILRTASGQELHPADAIVVFGAAEYSGRPSPVYRARLDHAYDLYQQKLALVVITTGGSAADPSFSEGGVGHDYLLHRGIPESSLIAETQGSDTAQSAERVAVIMRTNRMRTCIAVRSLDPVRRKRLHRGPQRIRRASCRQPVYDMQ
jgi:vancomycin permeability regulator SanA